MMKAHYNQEGQFLVFTTDHAPVPPFETGTNIFVCGALQDPEKTAALIGRRAPFVCAIAQGFKRTAALIEGRRIPFMVEDKENPHGLLTGAVWLGLTDQEVAAVEKLELEGGYREPIEIIVRAGELSIRARTYLKG